MLKFIFSLFILFNSAVVFSKNSNTQPAVPYLYIGYNQNTNFENRTCKDMIQIFSNYMNTNKLNAKQEYNVFKQCRSSCIAPSFLSDCRANCYDTYENRMKLHDQVVGAFLNALRARIAVYDVQNIKGPNRNKILNPSCPGIARTSAAETDQLYYQRIGFQCGRENEFEAINQVRAAYSSTELFQERSICSNFRENVKLWRDRFQPTIRVNPFADSRAIENQSYECPIRWTPQTDCNAVLSNAIATGPGCYMDLILDCQVNGAQPSGGNSRPNNVNRSGVNN